MDKCRHCGEQFKEPADRKLHERIMHSSSAKSRLSNTQEALVIWRHFPNDPPPKLAWGQYERYLVAFGNGHVMECSWLFGGWHERHDGCSERTNSVRYWCEKPKAPPEEE